MATTRIVEKISRLVRNQLPEYVRTDYGTFVTFVEAYYKFLEQDQGALELVQNARSYADIDSTTDAFVQYFLTNYQKDLPTSVLVNQRLLVKKINDLYTSKGSDLSFKLLFRLFYDTSVTVSHPYDNVLRPSDGQWEQRLSLRVERVAGSVADIENRFITYSKNNIAYKDAIVRVRNLSFDLYEIFLRSDSLTPYTVGDAITVESDNGTIFTGIIKPTATNYSITTPGTGFKAGQIFNINIAGAVDTLVRIIRVNATGGIELLKILNFGYGFTSDITIDLDSELTVSTTSLNFETKAGGFTETFELLRPHGALTASRYFFSDYVVEGYTGDYLVQASTTSQKLTSVTTVGERSADTAVITFTMGAVAKYPGQYISTRGFISDPEVRIQDSKLYQPFAYELASELDIITFYDIVKKLVHPAGTNLFVNRIIDNTANLTANISVATSRNVFVELNSVFTTLDYVVAALLKPLPPDSANTSDSVTLSVSKPLTDLANVIDDTFVVLYKEPFADSATINEQISLNIALAAFTDNVTLSESVVLSLGKPLDNVITLADTVNGRLFNYTTNVGATGYFLEDYVSQTVITV